MDKVDNFLLALGRLVPFILFFTTLYLIIRIAIENADIDLHKRNNGIHLSWDRHPVSSLMRRQGKRNHERRNYERALFWYELALKLEPKNPLILIYKGCTLIQTKKLDEAEALFNRVLELDPINYWANVNLGYVMIERHEFAKAVEFAKKAIKLERKLPGAFIMRFDAYFTAHDYVMALYDLEYLMRKQPKELNYYLFRASIYFHLYQPDAALEDVNSVMQILPNKAEMLNQRAMIYAQMGDYEAALADSNQAVSLDGSKSQYYDTRAAIQFSSGNYAEALKDYQQAKNCGSKHISSEIGLALVAYKTQRIEDSREAWSRVRVLAKDDRQLAEIAEGLGDAIQEKFKYPKPLYETIVEVEKSVVTSS